jgi:hypothetical protein
VSSDPAASARAILARKGYQTDLPLGETQATSGARPGAGSGAGGVGSLPVAPVANSLGTILLLVLAVLALAALAEWLVSRRRSRPAAPAAGRPAATPDDTAGTRAVLGDAERLARAGRFADAIHALLLHALAELGRRAGSPAASPAATSREVLRAVPAASEAKAALAPLVGAVERVHFGREPAGLDDYAACAAHFRRFTEAWRASR